jgi:DNA-binding MarR family transcriptional regulator
VPHESIAGLVKDLTTQLSAIAVEFGTRADRLADTTGGGTGEAQAVVTPLNGRELAKQLLAQRQARFDHFPAELFHEPAWDMLLALFVAHEERRTMNVKTLVGSAHAPVTTSQRWIDHLHKLKLIDRVIDPVDRRRMEISLSDAGYAAITAYLRRMGAA